MKITNELVEKFKHKRVRIHTSKSLRFKFIISAYIEPHKHGVFVKLVRNGKIIDRFIMDRDAIVHIEEIAKAKRQICKACGFIHEYKNTPYKRCKNCGKPELEFEGENYARRTNSGKVDIAQEDDKHSAGEQ